MPLIPAHRVRAPEPGMIIIDGRIIVDGSGDLDPALSDAPKVIEVIHSGTGAYIVKLDGGVSPGRMTVQVTNLTFLGSVVPRIVGAAVVVVDGSASFEVAINDAAGAAIDPITGDGFTYVVFYKNSSVQ